MDPELEGDLRGRPSGPEPAARRARAGYTALPRAIKSGSAGPGAGAVALAALATIAVMAGVTYPFFKLAANDARSAAAQIRPINEEPAPAKPPPLTPAQAPPASPLPAAEPQPTQVDAADLDPSARPQAAAPDESLSPMTVAAVKGSKPVPNPVSSPAPLAPRLTRDGPRLAFSGPAGVQPMYSTFRQTPGATAREEPRGQGQFKGAHLKTLGGQTVALDQGPALTLNVYLAPWCGFCRKETPVIQQARRTLALRGLPTRVIVGDAPAGDVQSYAAQFGPQTLLDERDSLGVRGYPQYIMTDGAGNIVKTHLGAFGSAAEAERWALGSGAASNLGQ